MPLRDTKMKVKSWGELQDNLNRELEEWKDNGKLVLKHINQGFINYHRKMITTEKWFDNQKKNIVILELSSSKWILITKGIPYNGYS